LVTFALLSVEQGVGHPQTYRAAFSHDCGERNAASVLFLTTLLRIAAVVSLNALSSIAVAPLPSESLSESRSDNQYLPSTILQKKNDSIFSTSICPASQKWYSAT
jgi:hypothetical protein